MSTPEERLAKLRPPMVERIMRDRQASPELRQRARDELVRRGLMEPNPGR